MHDPHALALDRRDRVIGREVDPGRQDLCVERDEVERREGADDPSIGQIGRASCRERV